jgi:hypothetical protein
LLVEIFSKHGEKDSVNPITVPPVGPPLHPLANEAGPLGMPDSTLVEPVALELEAVEAAVHEQVALEKLRRAIGQSTATESLVDGETFQARDTAAVIRDFEAECARGLPHTVSGDFDYKSAEEFRLPKRALDLRTYRLLVTRAHSGQERLDVGAGQQAGEERGVRRLGPPEADPVAADGLAAFRRRAPHRPRLAAPGTPETVRRRP